MMKLPEWWGHNKPYKIIDCLEGSTTIPAGSVNLVVTDPPYNIGKDHWDKIDNYIEWCGKWILEAQRILKDNGSFYFFHNDMETISKLMTWIENNTNFIFKQFIVWNKRFKGSPNKGYLDGFIEVEELRNYQKMAEYCLYYTFQDETGLSKIQGSCVYPIREYIRKEIIRAKGKIVLKEVNIILGTATNGGGVASATLSLDKTVPAMMTKEHYLMIREWLNGGKEYEYLRQEYEDLRYCFNNQKTHHSVWNYDMESVQGHITPKPVKLIENILLHSSRPNDICVDFFFGTGTLLAACRNLNRIGLGFEKDKTYEPIIRKRSLQDIKPLEGYF